MVLAARKVNPEPDGDHPRVLRLDRATRQEGREIRAQVRRRLRVGRFLLTVGVVFVLAFVLIGGRTRVTALGYHVADLEKQLEKVEADNEYLQVKIDRLSTPGRVEEAALKHGMTYTSNLRFVRLDPQLVMAEAQTEAAPATAVVSLAGFGEAGELPPRVAAAAPPASLHVVSQWFFEWLTGVRAAEAGATK